MQIESLMNVSPVIPVLTIEDPATAVPLAKALVAGGVRVLEVTLRTPQSLAAIRAIAAEVPVAIVGAGTVLNAAQLIECREAGSQFAVSPGSTPDLLAAARTMDFALLPGIATASELMMGIAHGYSAFKFFPAESIGGAPALKALTAPFAHIQFCPTGGISLELAKTYLAIPAVRCVGGSWLAPPAAVKTGDWAHIQSLAAEAIKALRPK